MNKFKAIIFDFGGVIELNESGNILEQIAKSLSVPADSFLKAYYQYNHLTNVKNMRWEDAVMEAVRVSDKSEDTENRIRKLIRTHDTGKTINTDLLSLFSVLRRGGFKVAILSNNTTDLRKHLEEKNILPLLDEVIVSAEIGHQKPHKEAFDIAFKKLGVRPEEVVFVDDSAKSLEKAVEIGYQPVLFKNNEQLKVDLAKLSIPVI